MTITFTIPAPCALISSNARQHHHQKAELTRTWRQAARIAAAKHAGTKLALPVHILAEIHKPRGGRWDPNNLADTTKACVDGMVDAGLIPDDSWREVTGPDHRRGTQAPTAITFTITPAQEDQP